MSFALGPLFKSSTLVCMSDNLVELLSISVRISTALGITDVNVLSE